ncbi:AraC-like DNA-binding protein [Cytobacillus purgationiresistens]|uniref:AraC-like DNA-binding protein n=1 Tax=Cytobacillus purgationiresistens TaxID=863449 RepID=A0ABU0ARS3_9BACI|nr:AraC-like DNA-binding protein [Cytobacillus purgationiresistens]
MEMQFVVVKKGIIEIRINGNKIPVSKGEGFFINSGIIHEIYAITPDATFICWNVGITLFDKHIQNKYILPLIQEGSTPYVLLDPLHEKHIIIIEGILRSFYVFKEQGKGFELVISSQYLLCLKELFNEVNLHSSNNIPIYDQRVKKILKYIHNNYHFQISLEQLAEIAYLSKSETIRLFKKHVGKTPFNYILTYRLERSIDLLIGTESTITEISNECGFSSVSYFIEKFKNSYDTTPKKFRKEKKVKGQVP